MGSEPTRDSSQDFDPQHLGEGGSRGWEQWNYEEVHDENAPAMQQNVHMLPYNHDLMSTNNDLNYGMTPVPYTTFRYGMAYYHTVPCGDMGYSPSDSAYYFDLGVPGYPVIMHHGHHNFGKNLNEHTNPKSNKKGFNNGNTPSKKQSPSSAQEALSTSLPESSTQQEDDVLSIASTSKGRSRRDTKRHRIRRKIRRSSAPPVTRAIRGRYCGNSEMFEHEVENLSPPDIYLSRYNRNDNQREPLKLFDGGVWDKVSGEIWEQYKLNFQNYSTFCNKLMFWKHLWIFVKTLYPSYGLFLVGSTMSGFGFNHSDIDLCLYIRHSYMDQRSEAVVHLEHLLQHLRQCNIVLGPRMIQAKVPILRFRDITNYFDVDLNCNNAVGIRNTHLQYCYSQLDWRVKPLVMIVKLWAKTHNINDAKNMTISSYSLVLMVIHFLQCGVDPPVLPCLHTLYSGKFTADSDIEKIDLNELLGSTFISQNDQSLGELLHDFLDYYVHFKYNEFAVSVRTASRIPIEECRYAPSYKNSPRQWKCLSIEEPFDQTNTAQSVYEPEVFEFVKLVFATSLINLKKTSRLESIFYPVKV